LSEEDERIHFYSGDEREAVRRAKLDDMNRRREEKLQKLHAKDDRKRISREYHDRRMSFIRERNVRSPLRKRSVSRGTSFPNTFKFNDARKRFTKLQNTVKTVKTDPFKNVSVDRPFRNLDRTMTIKVPRMEKEMGSINRMKFKVPTFRSLSSEGQRDVDKHLRGLSPKKYNKRRSGSRSKKSRYNNYKKRGGKRVYKKKRRHQ